MTPDDKPKKKLPVVTPPSPQAPPAAAQRELAVRAVTGGSRPEFPTRQTLARKVGAGLLGGATLLAGSFASAAPPAGKPRMPNPDFESRPAPDAPPPVKGPMVSLPDGSVDGEALAKAAPKFKVYREGGGIGPAEDMWQEDEVEAFINWTMAKEGKLNLQRNYAFAYDGVSFELDAFDPEKKVGYEYVDKLDGDRDAMTKEVRAKLDAWMKAKQVAILFIEVKKNPDASTIKGKILKFLAAVKKAPPADGTLAGWVHADPAVAAPPPGGMTDGPSTSPPPPPKKKPADPKY